MFITSIFLKTFSISMVLYVRDFKSRDVKTLYDYHFRNYEELSIIDVDITAYSPVYLFR